MRTQAAAGERSEASSEINLTPMLDVVFIMLIFFIVAASFVKEFGIEVSRPDEPVRPVAENDSILIAIGETNDIWIGECLIDPRAVRANLEQGHAENPGARVVIRAHKRSHNDTLVQVMNASREAGLYDLSIAAPEGTGAPARN